MRKSTAVLLVAGQIALAAGPARAAIFVAEAPQVGAFGGVRISVPLDRARGERQPVRAGLALAPTTRMGGAAGEVRTRIGEGLMLDLAGRGPAALSLAGTRLDRLGAAQDDEDGDGGLPTWAWIAGGVTVALGAGYLWFEDAMNDASE